MTGKNTQKLWVYFGAPFFFSPWIIPRQEAFFIVSIQIIGKHPNPDFGRLLTRFLSHTPNRILHTTAPMHTVKPYNTIFLFQDSCREAVLPDFPGTAVAIVSAENTDILRTLQASGIHTIPCGLSDHNTFTLTSSTEESTVISLQRSLFSLTGETIEPMEIPIHPAFSTLLSRYQLMAFCAVGCLTGNAAKLIRFFREEPV